MALAMVVARVSVTAVRAALVLRRPVAVTA